MSDLVAGCELEEAKVFECVGLAKRVAEVLVETQRVVRHSLG